MLNSEYIELIKKWQTTQCLESRNKAVDGIVVMLRSLVRKYKGRDDRDDVMHEAVLAAIEACNSYNPSKGGWVSYAQACARNHLREYIRKDYLIPRGSDTMHNYNLAYKKRPETHAEIVELAEVMKLPYSAVMHYALSGGGCVEVLPEMSGRDITSDLAINMEEWEHLIEGLKPIQHTILTKYFIEEQNMVEIAAELGYTKQYIHQIIQTTRRPS